MTPTIEYIQTRFDEYNSLYFSGLLPPVPIRLSHAKGFLGKVTFTRRKQGLFRGYRNENFVLRINVRIDLPEEVIEDTILHEMIHYYIAVNQLHDTSSHGRLFRQEMERINREGGRHITVSHRLSEAEQMQAVVKKKRIVAVVSFTDGRTGIKIVPNQPPLIRLWHRRAMRHFPIQRIDWYTSDNTFFARYPSSVALRIYMVEASTLPLDDAQALSLCSDNVKRSIY